MHTGASVGRGGVVSAEIYNSGWSDVDIKDLHKDYYNTLYEPANQSSFLIGTAAAGGTTYETYLVLAADLDTTQLVTAVREAALTFANSLATSYAPDLVYEAAIAFNSSLAVTSTATSVFEVAASFATSLAETNTVTQEN